MPPYVVKQGDYLQKIAHDQGFDADTAWNDPKNADLKKLRDPNLLCPGDLLYIPDPSPKPLALSGGTGNDYSADIPVTKLRLGFLSPDGPAAGAAYVINGLGDPVQGTTDGSGVIEVSVPVNVREIQVSFPSDDVSYQVLIGDMDPIEEPAGVRKRLQHLGYRPPTSPDESEADTEALDQQGIWAFQDAHSLDATGTIDDATKAALVADHGS